LIVFYHFRASRTFRETSFFLPKIPLPPDMPLVITFHKTLFHLRLLYHLVAYYHTYLITLNEFEWDGLDEDMVDYIFRVLLR
jgi:hypothetical protein